jgi:hypothetical protein
VNQPNKAIAALEIDLQAAKVRVEAAWKASAAKFQVNNAEWIEYHSAYREQLTCERDLAALKGEEHAIPIEFPAQWETGHPLPFLMKNDHRTFLTFFLKEHWLECDGCSITYHNPPETSSSRIAVVEFKRCEIAKMGGA